MPVLFETSYTLDTIDDAAKQFWQHAKPFRIIAFNAGMGAGKTTFIHALCAYLGVQDVVSSPTFALINEYRFSESNSDNNELVNAFERRIYHMDWYRLKNAEEAVNAGMEDCLLQPDALCLIEWPDIAQDIIPLPFLLVRINNISKTERSMQLELIVDSNFSL